MFLKNSCHIVEEAFSPEQIDYIISIGEKEQIKNAEIQDGEKSDKVRKTKVSWIQEERLSKKYPLVDIITKANKEAGWNFQLTGFEPFQYSIYDKGDHYDWHIDSHARPYDNGLIRKLSFTIILSDDYTGGAFELCKPNPKREKHLYKSFNLKKGSMILFPSFVWHKVDKVKTGTRKSLVGWVVGKPWF